VISNACIQSLPCNRGGLFSFFPVLVEFEVMLHMCYLLLMLFSWGLQFVDISFQYKGWRCMNLWVRIGISLTCKVRMECSWEMNSVVVILKRIRTGIFIRLFSSRGRYFLLVGVRHSVSKRWIMERRWRRREQVCIHGDRDTTRRNSKILETAGLYTK
jgi:hypothetical protein